MRSFYAKITISLFFLFASLVGIKATAQTYCTSGLYWYPCYYGYMTINGFSTTGGITNITQNTPGCGNSGTGYTYYSTQVHSGAPGSTVNFTFVNNPNYNTEIGIWVDWNTDGTFATTEKVYTGNVNWNQSKTGSFTIPSSATTGTKRMRVRGRSYGYYTFTGCSNEYYGETEDYNINVCQPYAITTHPANKSICTNNSTTFTISPATATAYQWQVDNGTGYTNISNGVAYSGATSSVLTVNALSATMNGYRYRVNATGCGTATSNGGMLTVKDSTLINMQSLSGSYCQGLNSELIIGTKGETPSSYVWEVDRGTGFVPLPNAFPYFGVDNDTLLITPMGDTMNGYVFRCRTTGSCNRDTTDNINITVDVYPGFISDPVDANVKDGQDAQFAVTSKGTAVYRWQASTGNGDFVNINDGGNYSGVLTTQLTVNNPSIAQTGYKFRCVLQGVNNCVSARDTTEAATMIVHSTLGIDDGMKPTAKATLFPNPATGNEVLVKLENFKPGSLTVKIADKLGRVVSEEQLIVASGNEANLNIGKLAPGVYTVTVEDKDHTRTEAIKFVKQ